MPGEAGRCRMTVNEVPIRFFTTVAFGKDMVMMIAAISPNHERLTTNLLGELAVTKVFVRAIEKGWTVSRPMMECEPTVDHHSCTIRPRRLMRCLCMCRAPIRYSGLALRCLKRSRFCTFALNRRETVNRRVA